MMRQVLSGIAGRLLAILVAIAGAGAAAILVAAFVFYGVRGEVRALSDEEVPTLRERSALISHTRSLQAALTRILIADGAEALAAERETAALRLRATRETAAGVAPGTGDGIATLIDELDGTIGSLVAAREARIAAEADGQRAMRDLKAASETVADLLATRMTEAIDTNLMAGDDTSEAIRRKLDRFTGQEIGTIKLVLDMQIEVRLLIGALIALPSVADETLRTELVASIEEAVADLSVLVGAAQPIDALDDVAALAESIDAVGQTVRADPAAAAQVDQIDILAQGRAFDGAAETAIDTLFVALALENRAARGAIDDAIGDLLDQNTMDLRAVIDLNSQIGRFVGGAFDTALAPDLATLDRSERALIARAVDLRLAATEAQDETLAASLRAVVALADRDAGLAPARRGVITAQAEAERIAIAAKDQVNAIAESALTAGNESLRRIAASADAMLTRISLAGVVLAGIALAGGVFVVLAHLAARRLIVKPVEEVARTTERLARGDLDVCDQLTLTRRGGRELCAVADALGVFRSSLIEQARLEAESQQRAAAQNDVVRALESALGRLSEGDLRVRLERRFEEGYESLRHDFNKAIDTLDAMLRQIARSSGTISSEGRSVARSAEELSGRASRTASTLAESASAIEELTTSVATSAESAEGAEQLAQKTRMRAEEGGEVMREAVSTMGEIASSSQEIGKIVGLIEDVAFQTNLLALNARVEAARAGTAGKGFAVVASEVRALAERTSAAAKEINQRIVASGTKIQSGVDLVDRTGAVLDQTLTAIAEIAGRMSRIATSAREQSIGISEINAAVTELDRATQDNAGQSEEVASTSRALLDEAATLTTALGRFRFDEREDHERDGRPGDNLAATAA